jgi:hypothetical protein
MDTRPNGKAGRELVSPCNLQLLFVSSTDEHAKG